MRVSLVRGEDAELVALGVGHHVPGDRRRPGTRSSVAPAACSSATVAVDVPVDPVLHRLGSGTGTKSKVSDRVVGDPLERPPVLPSWVVGSIAEHGRPTSARPRSGSAQSTTTPCSGRPAAPPADRRNAQNSPPSGSAITVQAKPGLLGRQHDGRPERLEVGDRRRCRRRGGPGASRSSPPGPGTSRCRRPSRSGPTTLPAGSSSGLVLAGRCTAAQNRPSRGLVLDRVHAELVPRAWPVRHVVHVAPLTREPPERCGSVRLGSVAQRDRHEQTPRQQHAARPRDGLGLRPRDLRRARTARAGRARHVVPGPRARAAPADVEAPAELTQLEGVDEVRGVRRAVVLTVLEDLQAGPGGHPRRLAAAAPAQPPPGAARTASTSTASSACSPTWCGPAPGPCAVDGFEMTRLRLRATATAT